MPPLADTDAEPLLPPLHATLVPEQLATITVGSVILKVMLEVHPLLSVTAQVQLPAVNPVTETVPSPAGFPGVQLYKYGANPPVAAFTLAAPFVPPKQKTLV